VHQPFECGSIELIELAKGNVGRAATLPLGPLRLSDIADDDKKLKDVIISVRKDTESGMAFSEALGRHPKVFGPLFSSMVKAGEIGGVLEDSLVRIADQLEKEDQLRRQVRSAMVYPAVVLTVALVVMVQTAATTRA